MKRLLAILFLFCLPLSGISAQPASDTIVVNGRKIAVRVEPLTQEEKDIAAKMARMQQGWHVMPIPIISYNTDLGFNFGFCADIYDYGTSPSLFPGYRQNIYAQASYYTKGQVFVNAGYDSEYLIPGVRFTSSLTYQYDPLYAFYGLDGDVSVYHPELDRVNGQAWHSYKRNMVRFMNVFQGNIVSHFNWIGGINYFWYKAEKEDFKSYAESPTLFGDYLDKGVIPENETHGHRIEIVAGFSWDSRDSRMSPTRGIWAEAYLNGSPDFFNTSNAYLRLTAHFRHYVTPGPDWLTIAMHGAFQGSIAGSTPFYMLQHINAIYMLQNHSDGLGGINTIRGMLGSRLLGESYAWGNFELRFRVLRWSVLGQKWFLGINPLFDLGAIVKPYGLDRISEAYGRDYDILYRDATKLHMSAGIGLKLGVSDNYLISLEWAKPFNSNDGPFGFAISVNYAF